MPVRAELGADAPCDDADATVVEPACPFSLAAALRVRETRPVIGVVCATVRPGRATFTALEQMTFLVKPFALSELEDACSARTPGCAEGAAGAGTTFRIQLPSRVPAVVAAA